MTPASDGHELFVETPNDREKCASQPCRDSVFELFFEKTNTRTVFWDAFWIASQEPGHSSVLCDWVGLWATACACACECVYVPCVMGCYSLRKTIDGNGNKFNKVTSFLLAEGFRDSCRRFRLHRLIALV